MKPCHFVYNYYIVVCFAMLVLLLKFHVLHLLGSIGLSVYLLLRQNHFVAEPTANLFLDHASASPAKVAVRRLVRQPLDHSM